MLWVVILICAFCLCAVVALFVAATAKAASLTDEKRREFFGPELVSTDVERQGLHAEDDCWPRKTSVENETTTQLPWTSLVQASKSPSQPKNCEPSAPRSSLEDAGVDSEEKRGVSARNPGLVEAVADQACVTPETNNIGTRVQLPAGPPFEAQRAMGDDSGAERNDSRERPGRDSLIDRNPTSAMTCASSPSASGAEDTARSHSRCVGQMPLAVDFDTHNAFPNGRWS